MLFSVVVLALSGLCAAKPEADPTVLLAPGPYAATLPYAGVYSALPYASVYSALPYATPSYLTRRYAPYYANQFAHSAVPADTFSTKTVSSPVATVRTLSNPLSPFRTVTPIATASGAVVPHVRPLGPNDCVTEGGCLVKSLKEAGLAKREAESDPQLIPATSVGALPYALSPYYPFAGAFYSNPLPAAYTTGLPYANSLAYAPYPYTVAAPTIAVSAPVVKAVEPVVAAAPAPVVETVVAAPTPIVKTVVARAPIATPVVEEYTRPVTYTHIGAHPINPTTVLETDSKVIGHQLI